MSQQLRIFVSHSHQDDAFAREIVDALRQANADVWYDEHNLGSGQLGPVIERELRLRPVFVVVLSPAALGSRWVEDECRWAYSLLRHDPTRIILPVTAAPIDDEQDIWLFLQDFKRVEAHGVMPYAKEEAIGRTLQALALTPSDQGPVSFTQPNTEDVEDLITRAKALSRQDKRIEAVRLLEQATQLEPTSVDAWLLLCVNLTLLHRSDQAMVACERVISLDPTNANAWNGKGGTLYEMGRFEEALAAYDHALTLDPNNGLAWESKGQSLQKLGRLDEALAAIDHGLNTNPPRARAWGLKGNFLYKMGRREEALAAVEQALALDASSFADWVVKGAVLYSLKRREEALAAYEQALIIDPENKEALAGKAGSLILTGRAEEGLAAAEQALIIDSRLVFAWECKAAALRILGRTNEADHAESQARSLTE